MVRLSFGGGDGRDGTVMLREESSTGDSDGACLWGLQKDEGAEFVGELVFGHMYYINLE